MPPGERIVFLVPRFSRIALQNESSQLSQSTYTFGNGYRMPKGRGIRPCCTLNRMYSLTGLGTYVHTETIMLLWPAPVKLE